MHRIGLLTILFLSFLHPRISLQASEGELLWRYTTGGRIRSRPAVSSDGVVYVLSEDRHLYALEGETGKLLWRRRLHRQVSDSLALASDGTAYVGLKNGDLLAINPSGGEVWRARCGSAPAGDPAIGGDGTIYVATVEGVVIAFSHTGQTLWSLDLPAPAADGPALDTLGTIYVPCVDRGLYAVTGWGGLLWRAILAGTPSTPAVVRDEVLFVATDYGSLVALDEEGNILWDFVGESPFLPAIASEERVFAFATDGSAVALDFEGEAQWEVTVPGSLRGLPLLNEGGIIYLFSSKGELISLGVDGNVAQIYKLHTSEGSAVLGPKGRIFVGEKDWLVYAYSAESAATIGWPQVGFDWRHSGRNRSLKLPVADQLFGDDADYVYLRYLSRSEDVQLKLLALLDIEERIETGQVTSEALYFRSLLSELVSEGLTKTGVGDPLASPRDFPAVRAKAAYLLSNLGDIRTPFLLARLLGYEYDAVSKAAIVRSLGILGSDRSGDSTRAIASALAEALRDGRRDERLVREAVEALRRIQNYHGRMPDDVGYEALMGVFRSNSARETRELALDVLKKAIISPEP